MISRRNQLAAGLVVLAILLVGTLFLLKQVRVRKHTRFDPFILEAANRYKIDPALIKAVIWQESKFNPAARGKAGEIGLMQVREDAAWEWAEAEKINRFHHEQITDPRRNILCGTFYLAKVYKRYTKTDNPVPYALADYNAGRTHVLRWNKGAALTNSSAFLAQVDYPSTRLYATNVMKKQREFKKDFPSF